MGSNLATFRIISYFLDFLISNFVEPETSTVLERKKLIF
jgi:hypothetical protein